MAIDDSRQLSRRVFVSAAPLVLAASAKGANDRIRIGSIGVGGRGSSHLQALKDCMDLNIEVVAVCDLYRPNLEKAVETVEQTWGKKPRTTVDYQELLSWDGIDAVIIATPDFWHCPMMIAAIKAGKDVYCEKPMGNIFSEVKEAYLTVKNSDRIVQIGTQHRSNPKLITASRYLEKNIIGKITRVEAAYNVHQPRWARSYKDVNVEDISWKHYQRPGVPAEPDVRLLRQWQLFRECSNGIAGLWMSHLVDVFHWFTGNTYPKSAVTQGGVYLWKDGRDTCDTYYTLLEYPNDCLFSWDMNLNNSGGRRNVFYGDRGTLDISGVVVEHPDGAAWFSGEGSEHPEKIAAKIELEPAEVNSHHANFIECIRSRKQPRAGIQAGFSHAVASIMSGTALDERRLVRFDEKRLEIV